MQMIIDLETKKDGASKLFCLLSNIQLSDSFTAKIYEELPPKLVKHKDMLGSDLYMALFSRDRNDLLLHFLSYERETLWPQKNIKSLFLHTVLRKQHWLLALLDSAASLENNFNATLNQHIELFKLIAFCNSSLDNADLWLAFVSKVQKATNFNGAYSDSLKMCHLEVQRQAFLLDFLRANSKFRTIGDVVVKFSILEPLLEHVDFNSNLYTKIEQLLEKNHQLKMEQLSIHQNKVLNLTCNDTHLLREYYIVKLTLDLLLDEIPVGANEQKIISVIKLMFRNIDNVESFVRTVEIVFSLLFLRHEHIRKAKRGSNVESKSMTTSVLTSPPTFYSQMSLSIKLEPPQVGFVCSRRVLEIILNFLRSVCVQRKHSKPSQNCNDSIKLRLKTINDEISEGLWRLTLIPEKTSPFVGSGKVTNFNYQLALKFHKSASDGDNSSERTSEEDQLKQKKVKKPFKRKLKKRVPRATSDGGNDRSSMSVQTSNTDVSDNVRDSAEFEDSSRTKNIICRMLMSPQSLINNSMDNPQAVEQVLEVKKSIFCMKIYNNLIIFLEIQTGNIGAGGFNKVFI